MNNLKENAAILAASVQYCNKEIDQLRRELIESTKNLESKIDSSVVELPEYEEFQLPDGLIFESHIRDLNGDFQHDLKQIRENFKTTSELMDSKLMDQIASVGKDVEDLASSTKETILLLQKFTVASFSILGHNHDESYSKLDHDHAQYETIEQVDKFKSDTNKHLTTINSLIQDQGNLLLSVQEILVDEDKKISESVSDLEKKLKSATDSINVTIVGISDKIDSSILSLNQKIISTRTDLQDQIDKKADQQHGHSNYSEKNHDHPEFDELNRKIVVSAQKSDNFEMYAKDQLRILDSELKKKLNSSESLTVKDVNLLISNTKAAILKEIPKPDDGDDGKDAHEWIFEPDAERNGYLKYKREDWKVWRYIDLLGNLRGQIAAAASRSSMTDTGGYGGGAGGGGTRYLRGLLDVEDTVPANGDVLVYDAAQDSFVFVDITAPPPQAINEVRFSKIVQTDVNGYIDVDYSSMNFTAIRSITLVPELDSDQSCPLNERMFQTNIDGYDLNSMTAVVFRNLNTISRPGAQLNNLATAPENKNIHVTVFGSI